MDVPNGEDPFGTPNFWRPSVFAKVDDNAPSLFPPEELDGGINPRRHSHVQLTSYVVTSIKFDNPYLPNEDLKLPDLNEFSFGPLEPLEQLDSAAVSSVGEHEAVHGTALQDDEDLWSLALDLESADKEIHYYTWEGFQTGECVQPFSAYISERGDNVFDAAIQVQSERNGGSAGNPVRPDVFLESLCALGLGRSSVLFTFDDRKKTFIPNLQGLRTSGCSLEASESLVNKLSQCGTMTRRLRSYVDRTFTLSTFASRVALATAISRILSALESQLSKAKPSIVSLLPLQQAFEQPHRLLVEVYDLVKALRRTKSNEELVSTMYRRCQHYEQESPWLRDTMYEILSRVSRPWLETVEQWVGFKQDHGSEFTAGTTAKGFVAVERIIEENAGQVRDEYSYHAEKMPSFITPEDGETVFEIGRSLRLLRKHHPGHPLSESYANLNADMSLSWQFGWSHLDSIVEKANKYCQSLTTAMSAFCADFNADPIRDNASKVDRGVVSIERREIDCWTLEVGDMTRQMEDLPFISLETPDPLFEMVSAKYRPSEELDSTGLTSFPPPLSLAAVLSFQPLLNAQARLVNAASVRLLLRSHHLQLHLNVQRSFHLLGNGVFVSRLSSALFDQGVSTTERQRGVVRSNEALGLRIGSREAWPPASSELRLALMGILSDCYQSEHHNSILRSADPSALPGSLSFSIRQLSESEVEKILDPQSLYALDFLRLQYTAPSPLNAVITSLALEKYDTIFKFLLRILRMLYVVTHIPYMPETPHAQVFRQQARHFVTSCATYFFDTGIREMWNEFQAYLDSLEQQLAEEDRRGEFGTRSNDGIESLRTQHELCLNRIMFALLLRNRQQKVMVLLEDIFTHILQFARLSENDGSQLGQVSNLHSRFNGKVKLFLDVCRGLVGKKTYSASTRSGTAEAAKNTKGEENTIDRLLLSLEMNGFYDAS